MTIGYDRPLYVLPFDHRGTFQKDMFGWDGALTSGQAGQIIGMKLVIYDGSKEALALGVPEDRAGIRVDEQFGADILRDAARRGYVTACPAEKSGQDEFDLEYGEEFARRIDELRPSFCKVLVRYNPEGDLDLNRRQAERLGRLSGYLHSRSGSRFMFELLVPPTPGQLSRSGGDKKEYDRGLRPELMVEAITQLQAAGVEPDVWKIEGIDRPEDCSKVVASVRRGGREGVGCIILGRGEGDSKVRQWLQTAESVKGFIGFAVGRTSFWGPLVDLKEGRIAREAAVSEIARRYRAWVDIFESAGPAAEGAFSRGGRT